MRATPRSSRAGDADALHDVPPREFVRARDALVARLRKEGKRDVAAAVRGLPKPKATVWAINRVARRERPLITRLLKAFGDLKAAQTRGRAGEIRGRDADLREALDAAVDKASAALADAGHAPTLETRRRIDETLRGAAAGASGALRDGALTHEIAAPGFEVFAGARLRAVPAAKSPRPSKRSEDDAARALLARRATQLDEEASAKTRAAREAERAVAEARERLKELQGRARASRSAAGRAERTATRARRAAGRDRD